MTSAAKLARKMVGNSPMVRFAVLTLIALAGFGFGIVRVVDNLVADQAEVDARHAATSFARLAVEPHLSITDVVVGPDARSRQGLAKVIRQANALGEFPRIKIWNRQHRVVYSNDPAEQGRVLPGFPELEAAFDGRVTTKLGLDRNDRPDDGAAGIPYQAWVPLSFGARSGIAGVIEVHIPENQLAVGLRRIQRHMILPIGVVFGLLYLVLLLIRAAGLRSSRRYALERGRLAAIVDASDEVILREDLEGNIVSWNRGAERTYGYRADEMLGRTLSVLVPPDRPDEVREILERIKRGERLDHYETKRVTKDGRTLDMSMSITPIEGPDSKIAGVAVIARDISARKRADEELRSSREQLAAAQRLAKLGSWTWDIASGQVTWSPELFRIWGIDARTSEPTYDLFIGSVHPDDRQATEHAIAKAVAECSGYETEFRIVRPDGNMRVVASSARVTVDERGAPTRMVGSALDVTDQKRVEGELRQSAADLKARAMTDPLTGLLNHGGFHEAVDRELTRCRREGGNFSVILFDLDGFKPINDTYGHAEGDRVLVAVAAQLTATCRPLDAAGRLGGDEFALLLHETHGADAAGVGERVTRAIGELGAEVGLSFGVGQWPEDGPEKEPVLFRADMALYAAKTASRDGPRGVN